MKESFGAKMARERREEYETLHARLFGAEKRKSVHPGFIIDGCTNGDEIRGIVKGIESVGMRVELYVDKSDNKLRTKAVEYRSA